MTGNVRNELRLTRYRMFVEKWEDFTDNVKKLTANTDPDRMRTVFKYDHKNGKLIITVTDDNVRLQYKTDQAQDVKKLEKLMAAQMRDTLGVVPDDVKVTN